MNISGLLFRYDFIMSNEVRPKSLFHNGKGKNFHIQHPNTMTIKYVMVKKINDETISTYIRLDACFINMDYNLHSVKPTL